MLKKNRKAKKLRAKILDALLLIILGFSLGSLLNINKSESASKAPALIKKVSKKIYEISY